MMWKSNTKQAMLESAVVDGASLQVQDNPHVLELCKVLLPLQHGFLPAGHTPSRGVDLIVERRPNLVNNLLMRSIAAEVTFQRTSVRMDLGIAT
eukprot:3426545-Amphidinium_carterae.1